MQKKIINGAGLIPRATIKNTSLRQQLDQFRQFCSFCAMPAELDGSFLFRDWFGCPQHARRAALMSIHLTERRIKK
jgi:hypothetical protein